MLLAPVPAFTAGQLGFLRGGRDVQNHKQIRRMPGTLLTRSPIKSWQDALGPFAMEWRCSIVVGTGHSTALSARKEARKMHISA